MSHDTHHFFTRGVCEVRIAARSMNNGLRLFILARDEVTDALSSSMTHAVSLVDPGTWVPPSLDVITSSQRMTLWMHDTLDTTHNKRAPSLSDVNALCDFADRIDRRNPINLLVHCHEGRSRSAAAAAILLMCLGVGDPTKVFELILATRCPVWPNWTMIEHADAALNCRGALKRACRRACARVRERYPAWVDDPRPENAIIMRP